MARLIIHAGLHKTGSSAVQTWLRRHAEALLEQRIAFPVTQTTVNGNAPFLARSLITPEAEKTVLMREAEGIFLDFCRLHADKDIILSAELLEIPFLPNVRSVDIPKVIAGAEDEIAPLKKFLPGFDQSVALIKAFCAKAGIADISFVYLLRNSVEKYNSSYAQRAKALVPGLVLETGLFDDCTRGFRHAAFTQGRLKATGFNPAVDVFGAGGLSPIDQFLDLAGIGERARQVGTTKIETINESIGEIGVLAAKRIIDLVDAAGSAGDENLRYRISKVLRRACADLPDRRFSGFSPETARQHGALQAELDGLMAPWLSPDRLAVLAEPRHAVQRSARTLDELAPEARTQLTAILAQVAKGLRAWGGDTGLPIRKGLRKGGPIDLTLPTDFGAPEPTRRERPNGAPPAPRAKPSSKVASQRN